jgi:hypothetical protein
MVESAWYGLKALDAVGFDHRLPTIRLPEVRSDVASGGMRWITVGPGDQPGTSISGLPVRL